MITVKGVSVAAIKPTVDSKVKITVNNGKKTPTGERNKSSNNTPIKPSATAVKRGMLVVISPFSTPVITGEPAT